MSDEMLEGLIRSHESALAEEERKLGVAQAECRRLTERVGELEGALRQIRNGWSGSDPMEFVKIARAVLSGERVL